MRRELLSRTTSWSSKASLAWVLALAGLIGSLGAGPAFGHGPERGSEDRAAADRGEPIYEDEATAFETDAAIVARETGLPIDEARATLRFQKEFAKMADDMMQRFPGQISGVWVEPLPARKGFVRFVDGAPEETRPPHVQFLEDGELPFEVQTRRAELAAEALALAGHDSFSTFFDVRSNRIRVEIMLPEGLSAPGESQVLGLVGRHIFQQLDLSGRALVLEREDLDLQVLRGRKEFELQQARTARGGAWMTSSGGLQCTSSWPVWGSAGFGVVTAGHCEGLNGMIDPAQGSFPVYLRRQHFGLQGDVGYYSTSFQVKPEFFADAQTVRDVNGSRVTSSMVGGTVCVYGRRSNRRSCSHVVEAVNVTERLPDGTRLGKLARVSGISTVDGDSGGGWSLGTEAWGILSGTEGGKSYFTTLRDALNTVSTSLYTTTFSPPSPPSCSLPACVAFCGGPATCSPTTGQCLCF